MIKSLLLLVLAATWLAVHSVAGENNVPKLLLRQNNHNWQQDLEASLLENDKDIDIDEFFDHPANAPQQQQQQQRILQGPTPGNSNTEKVNIWQKLKESLGAAILGILLIVVAPCLIWKNEGRHVFELAKIKYCKNKAVEIQCDSPTEETLGKMVHFVGNVTVGDSTLNLGDEDDKLNITEPLPHAVMIQRTVYIFQKFEQSSQTTQKNMVGGGETRTTNFSVREDWTTSPQVEVLPNMPDETNSRGEWDAIVEACGGTRSYEPDQSINNMPPQLKEAFAKMGMNTTNYQEAPHAQVHSPQARVGSFGLTEDIRKENPMVFSSGLAPVPNEYLPEDGGCDSLTKGSDNILRTFEATSMPQNGDIKVVYEYAVDGFEASFIVEQISPKAMGQKTTEAEKAALIEEGGFGVQKKHALDDRCFGKCHNDLGHLWMVRRGRHDVADMIHMATEEEAKLTKIMRIVGWLLLMVGWTCLFAPFYTALEVLPLLGGLGFFAAVLFALIVSCACCVTVTLLAYLRYRPLMVSILLLLIGGIWGIIAWRLNTAAETGGP